MYDGFMAYDNQIEDLMDNMLDARLFSGTENVRGAATEYIKGGMPKPGD